LHYIVVTSAAALMAIEVAGLGILSNYFSSALQVSTNIIGVVLIATALGYLYGGRRADDSANAGELSLMILLVAAWIGIALANHAFIAAFIGTSLSSVAVGSFLAATALFALPTFFLAAILPYAIKLHVQNVENSGASSGILYGLSTFGGILGTVLFGVILLPLLQYGGTFSVLIVALMFGAFIFGASWKYILISAPIHIFLLISAPLASIEFHKTPIFTDGFFESDHTQWVKLADTTSIFSRIQVHEGTDKSTGEAVRFMTVNGGVHSAGYLEKNDLIFEYAKYNRLGGHFNPAAKHALLIGGGSYSYANYFLTDTPLYDIDRVWELNNEHYHNKKTISLPFLFSSNAVKRAKERILTFVSDKEPVGRQIEGEHNHLEVVNQKDFAAVHIDRADILDTGFPEPKGYVHIHETLPDGKPGRVISNDAPLAESLQYPRNIIATSTLLSDENTNITIPLHRAAKEGEVMFAMLHRDNGNEHFDDFLVDGYEQIESLDVVEIDPRATALSEKYFGLNRADPRLRIFHEDARTYLNRTKDTYDIIYMDAFRSFYGVPWQLTTREATQKVFDALNENGVVVANVPGALSGPYSKLVQAEIATYRAIFPEVRIYATVSPEEETRVQNIILVGFKNTDSIRETPSDDHEINHQLSNRWFGEIDIATKILTDDFAPTDFYTGSFINIHLF